MHGLATKQEMKKAKKVARKNGQFLAVKTKLLLQVIFTIVTILKRLLYCNKSFQSSSKKRKHLA